MRDPFPANEQDDPGHLVGAVTTDSYGSIERSRPHKRDDKEQEQVARFLVHLTIPFTWSPAARAHPGSILAF